jgi:hypothetical protein
MQMVTKANRLAAVVMFSVVTVSLTMLIDGASAVEVTESITPLLPTPGAAEPHLRPSQTAVAPPSSDCFILGSRSFSIPFTVDASGTQPVEVHLFVARGPAAPWELLDRKRPDVPVKKFQYKAEVDGEYWFATRTIDAQGQLHPAGEIESQLKVYVDTTKPSVKFDIDADATGRVEAVLMISDATPLKNMQLRYVTDQVQQWRSVDVQKIPADGKLQFTPTDAWKQLSIQLVATDTPGNQSVVNHLLRRPRLAALDSRYATTAPSGEAIEASSIPYRIVPSARLNAQTVASPVIKLDRHKPKPPSNLVTAHGYAPETSQGSALDSFRGAAFPPQQPTFVNPAQPNPAQPNPAQPNPAQPNPAQLQFAQPRFSPTPQSFPPAARAQGPVPATMPDGLNRLFATPQSPPNRLTQTQLPAPETPEQISNGFGLNSPSQLAPSQSAPKQRLPGREPDRLRPETAPLPNSTEPTPSRARTAAEAMRPLSEKSVVPESKPKPQRERAPAPAPKPEIDLNSNRYQSMKSRPFESAIALGRAPVRYSDSERFSLEYELEAVGSQGVDAIELYGSTDGGQTWDLWGQDPDRVSPFDIETKEEGIFGFRIVVVSQNGLASPRPQRGETPDIVVVVDKVTPSVRITGAQ